MMWIWASAHRGKWSQLTPSKNGRKIKKRKHTKKTSFLCLCYILRAITAGRCRERRYADHIFIQIYFTMHNFVVKFSKFSSPQAARGHWPADQNPADVPGCEYVYMVKTSQFTTNCKDNKVTALEWQTSVCWNSNKYVNHTLTSKIAWKIIR